MKVIDAVKLKFFKYPTIYPGKSYDDVKFEVMHNYFIGGGGGQWAYTKVPEKGGYLTEPVSKKIRGEWVQKFNLPYGKLVIKTDIEPYFKEKIYELKEIDHVISKEFISRLPDATVFIMEKPFRDKYDFETLKKTIYLHSELKDIPPKTLMPEEKYNPSYVYFLKELKFRSKRDYPSHIQTNKEYSRFYEPECEYIKDDWRAAGIEHLEYWKDYFNAADRIKTYSGYPDPKKQKEYIEEHCIAKGQTIQQIAKDYEFPDFDGNNYTELSWYRWNKELKKIKEFIAETLHKLKG